MLIDSILFFNEVDLLEIRLNELDPIVDKFVIVESLETYTGKAKPAVLQENWYVVKSFEKKIHYVVLPNLVPGFNGTSESAWNREHYQRNLLLPTTEEIAISPDDIMIISDCDEIPRMATIRENLSELGNGIHMMKQELFYYCVNNRLETHNCAAIGTIREIKNYGGPQLVRERNGRGNIAILNGGWHFSFFGGPARMKLKVESYSHGLEGGFQDFLKKDTNQIISDILSRTDVIGRMFSEKEHWETNDPRLPSYFLNNLDRYRHFTEEFFREKI